MDSAESGWVDAFYDFSMTHTFDSCLSLGYLLVTNIYCKFSGIWGGFFVGGSLIEESLEYFGRLSIHRITDPFYIVGACLTTLPAAFSRHINICVPTTFLLLQRRPRSNSCRIYQWPVIQDYIPMPSGASTPTYILCLYSFCVVHKFGVDIGAYYERLKSPDQKSE